MVLHPQSGYKIFIPLLQSFMKETVEGGFTVIEVLKSHGLCIELKAIKFFNRFPLLKGVVFVFQVNFRVVFCVFALQQSRKYA